DLTKALDWLKKAAERQYADAERTLGDWYSSGQGGLAIDMDRAMAFYGQSASQGSSIAQQHLENVQNLKKDQELALSGDQKAQTRLQTRRAYSLFYGHTLPKDESAAARLFLDSAQKGDPEAEYETAHLYEDGI